MTKSELQGKLVKKLPWLTPEKSHVIVNNLIDRIASQLVDGNRMEIRGFGTLSVRHRKPQTRRNPKTLEKVSVGDRFYCHFRISSLLNKKLNPDL